MFIFIYIWGAIGTLIFGDIEPDRWGNIGVAMLTLMQKLRPMTTGEP